MGDFFTSFEKKDFLGCCFFFVRHSTSMHRKMEETILGLK